MASLMDNVTTPKTASVQAIFDGVDYLKGQFNAKMDAQVKEVDAAYQRLKNQGLSSETIDRTTADIRTRILKLQQDFEDVETNIRSDLTGSGEAIEAAHKSIVDDMQNGLV